MAALDSLLRAVVQNRMECLILEPGSRPKVIEGGAEREVTRSVLDGPGIARLLAEVAPEGMVPPTGTHRPWEFDYLLENLRFHFDVTEGQDGFRAVATSRPTKPAAAAPPPPRPEAPVETSSAQPLPSVPELLREMVERRASDLHLTSRQPVRLRVDGELEALATYQPPEPERLRKLLFEITPQAKQEEFESTQDADFGYEIEGVARFRVNLFGERQGPSAAFRRIPQEIPSADDLNLPESLRKLADLPKGLVLVTGPTGSGKSTSLAALVDLVNSRRADHIITIEDPIEFVHRSRRCLVHQRQVGIHTESFAKALRAALREDPDVVLVGEMRDLETTAIAIQTAETGHLVFGTLHTTSAPATVERLINQYPASQQDQVRLMLADSLKAVCSQALLRRIGGGRVAAFEILLITPAISNMIREGKTFQIPSAMQTGRKAGMRLLNDSLMALVESKTVEPQQAYSKAADREDLLNRFRNAGISTAFLESQAAAD